MLFLQATFYSVSSWTLFRNTVFITCCRDDFLIQLKIPGKRILWDLLYWNKTELSFSFLLQNLFGIHLAQIPCQLPHLRRVVLTTKNQKVPQDLICLVPRRRRRAKISLLPMFAPLILWRALLCQQFHLQEQLTIPPCQAHLYYPSKVSNRELMLVNPSSQRTGWTRGRWWAVIEPPFCCFR